MRTIEERLELVAEENGQFFIRRGDAALVWNPYARDLVTLHTAGKEGYDGGPCNWLDVDTCSIHNYAVEPPRAKLSRPGVARDRAVARYLRRTFDVVTHKRLAEEVVAT